MNSKQLRIVSTLSNDSKPEIFRSDLFTEINKKIMQNTDFVTIILESAVGRVDCAFEVV